MDRHHGFPLFHSLQFPGCDLIDLHLALEAFFGEQVGESERPLIVPRLRDLIIPWCIDLVKMAVVAEKINSFYFSSQVVHREEQHQDETKLASNRNIDAALRVGKR